MIRQFKSIEELDAFVLEHPAPQDENEDVD
jgi:hypothetical protein